MLAVLLPLLGVIATLVVASSLARRGRTTQARQVGRAGVGLALLALGAALWSVYQSARAHDRPSAATAPAARS